MAMIDYGAIAFHNGKCVSTGMFTPMEDTVGYTCKYYIDSDKEQELDGKYFAIVGNKWLLMGFYKSMFVVTINNKDESPTIMKKVTSEYLGSEYFEGWKAWRNFYFNKDDFSEIKITHKNGYYCAKVVFYTYKNRRKVIKDRWKTYFGYGVDYNFYKKTGRVNYYRSPEYLIINMLDNCKFILKQCIQSLRRMFKRIKMFKTKAYLVYNKNQIEGWGVYVYTYSKKKAIQLMKHAERNVCIKCSHPKDDCQKCPMKKGELFNDEDLMVERHKDADFQYRGLTYEFVYYHAS